MPNHPQNQPRTVPENLQLMSHRMPYISKSTPPSPTTNNGNESRLANHRPQPDRLNLSRSNHQTPRKYTAQALATPSSSTLNLSPISSAPPSVNTALDLTDFSSALDGLHNTMSQRNCQCNGAISSLQQQLSNWPQQQNLQALVLIQTAMEDFKTIVHCQPCMAFKKAILLRVALSRQLLAGFQSLLECWRDLPMTDNITSAQLGEFATSQHELCAVYFSMVELHLSRLKGLVQSIVSFMDNPQLFLQQRQILHTTVISIEKLQMNIHNVSFTLDPILDIENPKEKKTDSKLNSK